MPIIVSYILLLVSALALAAIGVLIAFIGEKACLSQQCVGQGKFIHRSMNEYLEKCDDFYSFTCDDFPKFGRSIYDDIELNAYKILQGYLNTPPDWETDGRIQHIARTLYANCKNDSQLEFEGLKPLERISKRIGGFPFLDPLWNYERKDEFGVVKIELRHFFNGLNALFINNRIIKMKYYPELHPNNETNTEAMYWTYSIPPHLFKAVAPDSKDYLNYCIEFNDLYTKALQINHTMTEALKKEILEAANFKQKLIDIVRETISTKNCSEQPFSFTMIRDIKMNRKRNYNFGKTYYGNGERTIDTYVAQKAEPGKQDGVRYVAIAPYFLDYFDKVGKLINNTSPRGLANYMAVEALIQMTPYLPKRFRDLYDNYLKSERDKANPILNKREMLCAKVVKGAMSVAVTASYLTMNPNPVKEDERFTLMMVATMVKQMLRKMIKRTSNWASKKDQNKMLQLLDSFRVVTPLTQEVITALTKKDAFENFFLIMCMTDDSTLESYLNVKAVEVINNGLLLTTGYKPVIFHEHYDIFGSTIYFERKDNTIVVPMAYLYYPSIDGLWPKYLSYGGLAVWLARVMIKTIGYNNVIFPPLRDPDFMRRTPITYDYFDEHTRSEYEKKRQCAMQDYNQYLRRFNVHADDANCLEETLYNAAAVQVAYKAYKAATEMRFFVEARLPYLTGFNVDQTFFLKFASSFCTHQDNKFYTTSKDTSKVSRNFTILYALRNFPEFSRAFKCDANDKMTKQKPCDIYSMPLEK